MAMNSPDADAADPLAAANPRPSPAANNFDDPALAAAAALSSSLFDVVHGTTATADVGEGTAAPWWSSQHPPPCYAGSGAYASSPFPPPPLQSHGDDLGCYAGDMMDTSFPQLPAPPLYMQMQPEEPEELSYLYYPQPAPFVALEPTTMRPELPLQVPTTTTTTTTQPASLPPPLYYPQTQATTTTSSASPAPALADTQQAQEDDTSRPAPRRRGRPCKRALAVSESEPPAVSKPTKRVAVGRNRATPSSSSSQKTSSAASTGSRSATATLSSAAGQVVPDQAVTGAASSSITGSTSSGQQTADACTSTNDGSPAPAGVVVVEGHHHEHAAAAIAPPPPELATTTTTTGRRYADTSAVGVRFQPTDQELIYYLRMKYAGQQMPVDFFKEFDVYQAHPMAIQGACGESQNGCWYVFSPRDRKYRNGQRPARSVFVAEAGGEQVGFWKSNSKLGKVRAGGRKHGAVVGRMTSLTFQLGRQPRGKQTGWKMKEYTIPENQRQADGSAMLLNDWVMCKLFYKERPTRCTEEESKTEEDATSVGQKRPRRSRKSKKDTNGISVAVVGQEDGPGEAAGEGMQGEEGMQPQLVPAAAHKASDYSEQDLCVEDYLVSDVAFAQQNDA